MLVPSRPTTQSGKRETTTSLRGITRLLMARPSSSSSVAAPGAWLQAAELTDPGSMRPLFTPVTSSGLGYRRSRILVTTLSSIGACVQAPSGAPGVPDGAERGRMGRLARASDG